MRQFYIPSIGDKIVLEEDWECTIFFERRNATFIERARPDVIPKDRGAYWVMSSDGSSVMVTFPKGTVLTVDRIYIRKGKGEWDSVTFNMPKQPKVAPFNGRFWAKLEDVNEIKFEKVE
jgi:hypothetical protein